MGFEYGLPRIYHFLLRLYIFNLVIAQMTWKTHYPGIFLTILVHTVIHTRLAASHVLRLSWRAVPETALSEGRVPTDWTV